MMLFAPSHGGGPYDTFKAWIILSLQLRYALPKSVRCDNCRKGPKNPKITLLYMTSGYCGHLSAVPMRNEKESCRSTGISKKTENVKGSFG